MKMLLSLLTILNLGNTYLSAQENAALNAAPPLPYGAVPTRNQLEWAKLEQYAFVHFSINTFTNLEWGNGDEDPKLFNPTAFDADQIVRTIKESGLKGLILTAKHHDGFCLWPSAFTEHSVKNSPWKDGKGDVVREISDACRRQGLLFGVYLSPWDRNRGDYGKPEYITYFRNQLRELLSNYGPIFEVWFDGANGGNGYYGGANETRTIDRMNYYDWPATFQFARELQPGITIWSDPKWMTVASDIRWVGNEQGKGPENSQSVIPKIGAGGGEGIAGSYWMPPEADVSIRPGWFYHANQDDAVKTPEQLLRIYFETVGRNTALLLNVPLDQRGGIHEKDVQSLRGWKSLLDQTFAKNLAGGCIVTASNTRGNSPKFSPSNVIADSADSYWTTDNGVATPELVLDLGSAKTFNVVKIREYLPFGQRIQGFALDYWKEDQWKEFTSGTTIGNQRLLPLPGITTSKVRLRITKSAASPVVSEFGLYKTPSILVEPKIERSKDGMVTLSAGLAGLSIRYTQDGSEPKENSPIYERPFPLLKGGSIRACAVIVSSGQQSAVVSKVFGIAKGQWKVVNSSYTGPGDGDPGKAIDERENSIWDTMTKDKNQIPPQGMTVDLGQEITVKGFTYFPRQDHKTAGIVDQFEFYTSLDGKNWGKAIASGEFSNIEASPDLRTILFKTPELARYFRFVGTHSVGDNKSISISEIGILSE